MAPALRTQSICRAADLPPAGVRHCACAEPRDGDHGGDRPRRRLAEDGRMSAHDFAFTTIDGAALPLAQFRGRPILVANTASQCGFTPQYADLEALWRRYRERGLVVIAVPSNDFGAQEPGSAPEIKEFCETRYAVDFPLAGKEKVAGAAAHPFFRWIEEELGEAGVPRWNFHKYLIAPDGNLAGAWPSRVKPTDAEITAEIEKLVS
jgi:glutathione peroxidase